MAVRTALFWALGMTVVGYLFRAAITMRIPATKVDVIGAPIIFVLTFVFLKYGDKLKL